MNINIAILENNKEDYLEICRLLTEWSHLSKNTVSVSYFSTDTELYISLENHKFDLLITQVRLYGSSEPTGLDMCKKIISNGYKGKIILLDDDDKYAIKGYYVNALGYLVKPIDPYYANEYMNKYTDIMKGKYYTLITKNCVSVIDYNDIIYFYKIDHDVHIQTTYEHYIKRTTLKEIEEHLPTQFVRCHKSCIVNMLHIKSFVGNTLYLSNNKSQTIGRCYLPELKNKLADYRIHSTIHTSI